MRQKAAEERKGRKIQGELNIVNWEEELVQGEIRIQMKSMWEIPQIAHFIFLTMKILNLFEIQRWEIERMFLIPQASSLLATIMTTLLVRPHERMTLIDKPPMPYTVWSKKLIDRITSWYAVYRRERKNPLKVS